MNTIEGNKLIAEFMGALDETGYFQSSTIGKTKVPTGRIYFPNRNPDNMHLCSIDDLKYHTSWDWLMPVVEKIEAYSCLEVQKVYLQINDKSCAIWTYFDVKEFLRLTGDDKNEAGKFKVKYSCKTKIEAVYNAVTDFIQWYNNQTPTNK